MTKFGGVGWHGAAHVDLARDRARVLDLDDRGERDVDRGDVLGHDVRALAGVGLLRVLLHELDGLVGGKDAGDLEEGGLHDGVDPGAHPSALGDLHAVDDVELELLVDDALLDLGGDLVPDLVGGKGLLRRKTPPCFELASMSRRSRKENLWQARKSAFPTR